MIPSANFDLLHRGPMNTATLSLLLAALTSNADPIHPDGQPTKSPETTRQVVLDWQASKSPMTKSEMLRKSNENRRFVVDRPPSPDPLRLWELEDGTTVVSHGPPSPRAKLVRGEDR